MLFLGDGYKERKKKRKKRNISEELPESGPKAIRKKETANISGMMCYCHIPSCVLAISERTTSSSRKSDCTDLSKRNLVLSTIYSAITPSQYD